MDQKFGLTTIFNLVVVTTTSVYYDVINLQTVERGVLNDGYVIVIRRQNFEVSFLVYTKRLHNLCSDNISQVNVDYDQIFRLIML